MSSSDVETVAIYDFVVDSQNDPVDKGWDGHHVKFGKHMTTFGTSSGSSPQVPNPPQATYFAVYRDWWDGPENDQDEESPEFQITYLVKHDLDRRTFDDFIPISSTKAISNTISIYDMTFTFHPEKVDDNGNPFMRWAINKQSDEEGLKELQYGWAKMRNEDVKRFAADDLDEEGRYSRLKNRFPTDHDPETGRDLPWTTLSKGEKQRLGL